MITDRIDNITNISPEYRRKDPPCPKSVKIELTAKCDFNCFFCASGQRLRKKADMDAALFKRLVLEMREAGVEELGVFYLGESFTVDWLPEAIRYAKQDCGYPYVFLTTNGRLATPDVVSQCMAAGLDSLKFSYNNADEQQFTEVTGVKAKEFNKIKYNIIAARAVRDVMGYDCNIYASSIRFDGEQQKKMQNAVNEILPYVDQHYWLPLYNQGSLASDSVAAKGKVPVAGNQGRIGALRAPLPCWSLFTEGHVTYDGYLSACCFDHDGRFQMGDLKEISFLEAWRSDKFQALRQANLDKDVRGTVCENCVAWH